MLTEQRYKFHFLIVEKISLLYFAITLLIALSLEIPFANKVPFITLKTYAVLGILFLGYLSTYTNSQMIIFLRYAFVLLLLSIWYPETFEINRYFSNQDHIIAQLEQQFFGFQPALYFHEILPQKWFSEIMNFGYFSFYPVIILCGLYFYYNDKLQFQYYFFMLLVSFYVFYIIFIFFPSVGPQYYFNTIGIDNAQNGFFPELLNYYNFNSELSCQQFNSGFFLNLVEKTQLAGEKPTAAFPSSHVGISTLIMLVLLEKKKLRIFLFILPIYLALVASTVYIQAHYLVDVIAGFISAIILYFTIKYLYNQTFIKLGDDLNDFKFTLVQKKHPFNS